MYREHTPHPALKRHIECYWSIDAHLGPGARVEDSVLPDGCMDILFNLGSAPIGPGGVQPDRGGTGSAPFAVGTMTHALDVTYSGTLRLVGIRFRPGGATPFLRLDAVELTNGTAPLDALWGGPASGEAEERLAAAGSADERVAVLDTILLARLERASHSSDERVLAASELLASTHGDVALDDLADAAGLGRRQLERRFLATVGLSPKHACRVARFRAAVGQLYAEPTISLSRLAHRCGYADQPHLTREFTEMAGQSPGEYRRARYGA